MSARTTVLALIFSNRQLNYMPYGIGKKTNVGETQAYRTYAVHNIRFVFLFTGGNIERRRRKIF